MNCGNLWIRSAALRASSAHEARDIGLLFAGPLSILLSGKRKGGSRVTLLRSVKERKDGEINWPLQSDKQERE
jgi:hypothetical protein